MALYSLVGDILYSFELLWFLNSTTQRVQMTLHLLNIPSGLHFQMKSLLGLTIGMFLYDPQKCHNCETQTRAGVFLTTQALWKYTLQSTLL